MASNYPTVQYGSRGETVRQLQRALNQVGYSLEVDGGFGPKTKAAVIDYQKKNNLRVDGVAGSETMGSLLSKIGTVSGGYSNSKQVLSGVSDETADALYRLEKGYTPSDEVKAAQSVVDSMNALKPGAYQSGFEGQLAALYDEINNRPAFSYDPAEDAAYRRYAEIYTRQGKAAMEDTMGRSAALTGGYGSSYAQSAGQQAYHQYLQELSELVPEFEKNAWDRYTQQGEAMMDRYELFKGEEAATYGRWQDEMEEWYKALDLAQDQYEGISKQDVDNYQTMLAHYTSKAGKEQAASNGVRMNNGKVTATAAKASTLSSTASNSLQRAMDNYLRAGDKDSAKSLATQYKSRMTATQKKKVESLFGRYGMRVGW